MSVEQDWVFGEPPLPTVVELAGALRDLTDTVQSLERTSPELEALVQTVRDAQRGSQPGPGRRAAAVGDASADRRVYVDHGYTIGEYNPCFPRYTSESTTRAGSGTALSSSRSATRARPGSCTAGSSGCSSTACSRSSTARSGSRARRPSSRSASAARRRCSRRSSCTRRVPSWATASSRARGLELGERVLCEAEMRAAVGDRSVLRAVSPRR